MPALDPESRAALKADIAERGVLVAVEIDEADAILDGHHRVELWTELRAEGVKIGPYPFIVRDGWTEQQKRTHVRQLNLSRRHLSQEQRRQLIAAQLAEVPEASNRQVARDLGVSHHTVEGVRTNLEATGQIAQSVTRQGADGRTINTANIGTNPTKPAVASFAPPVDPPSYEEPGIQIEELAEEDAELWGDSPHNSPMGESASREDDDPDDEESIEIAGVITETLAAPRLLRPVSVGEPAALEWHKIALAIDAHLKEAEKLIAKYGGVEIVREFMAYPLTRAVKADDIPSIYFRRVTQLAPVLSAMASELKAHSSLRRVD